MEAIFLIIILIFSVVIHEVSHGSVANALGDPTARHAGRLTLNPLKHLDPIGSVLVPMFLLIAGSRILFGWAKPVPINPYNFRDQKYGQLKVAAAGPLSNFSLALLFGVGSRLLPVEAMIKRQIFQGMAIPMSFWELIFVFFIFIVFINVLLAVFNLIPIPPLDGSHVLFTFFPRMEYKFREIITSIGPLFLPLMFLVILMIFPYIVPVIVFISRLFLGI